MGAQFGHYDSYSRVASTKARKANSRGTGGAAKKWSASEILDEVNRVPGAIGHVENPKPPIWLRGNRKVIEAAMEDWAATTTDSIGRKVRVDALCMGAGVISLNEEEDHDKWASYKADAIIWLEKKYGDWLLGIVEHIDEPNPHFHFYAVPKPGDRFSTVHEGRLAYEGEKDNGGPEHKCNAAYKKQMRLWQDELYAEVSVKYGIQRFQDQRGRVPRHQHMARKHQEQHLAEEIRKAETLGAELDQREGELRDREAMLRGQTSKFEEEMHTKDNALTRREVEMLAKFHQERNDMDAVLKGKIDETEKVRRSLEAEWNKLAAQLRQAFDDQVRKINDRFAEATSGGVLIENASFSPPELPVEVGETWEKYVGDLAIKAGNLVEKAPTSKTFRPAKAFPRG